MYLELEHQAHSLAHDFQTTEKFSDFGNLNRTLDEWFILGSHTGTYEVEMLSIIFYIDVCTKRYSVLDRLSGREPELLDMIWRYLPVVNVASLNKLYKHRYWIKQLGEDWEFKGEKLVYKKPVIPLYVIANGKIRVLKPEYREDFAIKKLTYNLSSGRFSTEIKTLHSNVDSEGHVCVGGVRISSTADLLKIVQQLRFINLASAYRSFKVEDYMLEPEEPEEKEGE